MNQKIKNIRKILIYSDPEPTELLVALISGLMIQMLDNSHGQDGTRDSWLEDPNFTFYTNLARQLGFLVDKHAPWRLIANITSPNMLVYWIYEHLQSVTP